MKVFSSLVLLFVVVLLLVDFSYGQLGYVNFTPMNSGSNCSGSTEGTGYSWQMNTCIEYRDLYYFIKYFDQDDNSYVTFYIYKNNTCDSNDYLTESYSIGSCIEIPTSWSYGWYYDNVDWAKVSVHNGPSGYIPPEGYRQTLYQVGDSGCQTNYLLNFYYTNQIQFHNTLQTFTFWCQNNVPMQKVCTQGSSCITTSMSISCSNSDSDMDDFDHNFIGYYDVIGDQDYYYSVTC